jgi:hypothetical protein
MSMNVYIIAGREITFKKRNGEVAIQTQTVYFDAWQTPTDDTYRIVGANNPKQAYIDWVMANFDEDEEFNRYAYGDIFHEGEPIGVDVYNAGKAHVQEFLDWVEDVEENGYKVEIQII